MLYMTLMKIFGLKIVETNLNYVLISCLKMYLKQNHMSRLQRSLMAQLRCGILPLKIETGRFQNVKDILPQNKNFFKVFC